MNNSIRTKISILLLVFLISLVGCGRYQNNKLLEAAIKGQNTDEVNNLLSKGADVNAKDWDGITALMYAANYGHVRFVKALLSAGADVNMKDKNGMTALMWAAGRGNTDIVKELISQGADVNAKMDNKIGWTALIFAADNGRAKVVRELISAGADINSKDIKDKTALYHAKEGRYTEIVELLKQAGAKE